MACYRYTYDSLGRLIYSSEVRGSVTALRTQHSYDTDNRIIAQSYQLGGTTFTEGYTYRNTDGAMTEYTLSGGADGKKDVLSFGYDNLKRLGTVTAKTVTTGTSGTNEAAHYTKTYTYRDISSTRTTTQIAKLQYTDLPYKPSYAYTYDAGGQISRVTDETGEYMDYCYDLQGQLTNATLRNWTGERIEWYDYNYDTVGNILSWTVKGHRTASHTYTYGNADWPDLLTAFDGQTIWYEGQTSVTDTPTSGNPIRYPAPNGYFYLEWADGRKLEAIENTSNQLSFTYGQDGLRTSKTVEYTATHNYYYAGGKLLRETYDNNTLDFAYDAEGKPYSLTYNGTKYYYITNAQGDVMYLVNSSGAEVATYVYSPYGEVLTAAGSMAAVNPLRYRGYYYDSETGLYYLQSRYYNPVAGRFINADGYASTGQGILGYNMFAYCNNCPPIMADVAGTDAVILLDKGHELFNYGHTGALIQDSDGDWYHFYFGGIVDGFVDEVKSLFGVTPMIKLIRFNGDPTDLDSINHTVSSTYGGKYDEFTYLEGDFTSCITKAREGNAEIMGTKYHAITNNCNDVTYRLLASAGTKYTRALKAGVKGILPTTGYRNFRQKYLFLEACYAFLKIRSKHHEN